MGWVTDFGCYKLSWCDGRCVQGPGTYSPRHADPRLLAIPLHVGELQTTIRTETGFKRLACVHRLATRCLPAIVARV